MKKIFYLETYGCQMNEYDSELIRTILIKNGFQEENNLKKADVILLNTCSVREGAENKIFNRIHVLKKHLRDKKAFFGILGCMAPNLTNELLFDRRLGLDFIVGPDNYQKLPQIILAAINNAKKEMVVDFCPNESYSEIFPTRMNKTNAWLTIMRGCNNFCTFCVVPYTRGRERSSNPENILREINKILEDGFSQVTLLGQNVNSYKYGNYTFTDLIKLISDIKGLKRIRFMSPHPKDFPLELLEIMAEKQNICKHIHLPLQSGNSRILKNMHRPYTKEEYLALIKKIKEIIPNIAITTDIIIGFPTETEAEFLDTLDVVKQVQFDSAFMFKYSPRPKTIAAKKFPDDISDEIKTKRIVKLNEVQKRISLKKNLAQIGKIQEVLIEQLSTKKNPDHYQGRNDGNKIVIIPKGKFQLNEYLKVKIFDATANVLKGEPV